MDYSQKPNGEVSPPEMISAFIERSAGLQMQTTAGEISILQKVDNRCIRFTATAIEEVLFRHDSEGREFLQVNFVNGRKILITEKLVGFKPAETSGLDLRKLPKVVTTPDLVSVVEAIEESVNEHGHRAEEVDVLRRVFDSVLNGAEAVGFEVGAERNWLNFITNNKHKASA